jgi:hypothetical protein
MMNKPPKLKEWLTLDEAKTHISNVLGESLTIADIYQFALDGYLVLSVNFVNVVKAKKVTFIKKEDIKYRKVFPKKIPSMPEGAYFNVPINAEHQISREYWIENIEDKIESLSGVWDLSMIGTAKFSIKQLYLQEISSDIKVKLPEVMSVYVKDAEETYQLQLLLTKEEYRKRYNNLTVNGLRPRILDSALAYPASRLDELDHVLVMKVKEVTRFIQSLEDVPQEEKPLMSKERTSLLVVIGSLLKAQGIDPSDKGIAPAIKLMTETAGTPISENTLRKILKQINDIIN